MIVYDGLKTDFLSSCESDSIAIEIEEKILSKLGRHIPKAELLECFQWLDEKYDIQYVKEEQADVLVYCQNLLGKLGLDADEIINMKMIQNEAKYPMEKAKGKPDK